MRLNVRFRIFLFCAIVLLGILALADHFLTSLVQRNALEQARRDLLARLALIQREVQRAPAPVSEVAFWDQLADEAAQASGTRVSLLRPDGTLLGDSQTDAAALLSRPRLADAPEVEQALAERGTVARTVRDPTTPTVAVAAALLTPEGPKFALRLSRGVPEALEAAMAVQRIEGGAVLMALLVSILVAAVGPRVIAGDVRDLAEAARRISAGDLSVRLHLDEDHPYAALGKTLEQMSDNLTRSLAAFRAERDLVGRILEGMEEGVVVLDDSLRVVLINRALSDMLLLAPSSSRRTPGAEESGKAGAPPQTEALSPLDVGGKSLLEVTGNPDLSALLTQVQREGDRATAEIELGDLKPRRLLARATRLAGAPWGFMVVFVDVTEMRRLESLRRDFVANVSHELRTPVASLRTAAETLRGALAQDPAAAERFIAMIERNAERLHSLVEDLLDLSRIESREYRLNAEPLEVAKFVGDVANLFRDRAERRRLRMTTAVAEGLPSLRTDRRALEQVLVNLLDNAVRYCPDEAAIALRARGDGGAVVFTVEDSGPGIDEVHLPRLFERFYRVDPGRTRDRGGTGLGLAIVKHLVEALGGDVSVTSAVGRGTTFTVRLPFEIPARRVLRAS